MTASVLKQDPNTEKVQNSTIYGRGDGGGGRGGGGGGMQIFGLIPFIKLQNNT